MSSMISEEIIKLQTITPFPKQTIEKIIRSALPKKVRISDDFKNAVNRCAQIYVISVAATAQSHYKNSHLTEDNIIEIIGLMGFEEFVKPLEQFRKELSERKSKTRNRKSKKIGRKVESIIKQTESCEQQLSDPNIGSNIAEDIGV